MTDEKKITHLNRMKKKEKGQIVNLLDEAESTGSIRDYQHAYNYLISIREGNSKDAEFHYYMGYTALCFPDNAPFYRKQALREFEKTLELDPQHKNAYFQLINTYYELGNFHLAADGYAEVLKMLKEEKSEMVSLSVYERVLCCYLHLNWHSKFIDNYDLWIRAYRSTQEIESMTLPRDLILTLADYLKNKGDRISSELSKQFKNVTIDLLSILKLFPKSQKNYKNQIETLKNWDGQYSGPYIYELV